MSDRNNSLKDVIKTIKSSLQQVDARSAKHFYFPKYSFVAFLILISAVSFRYHYPEILTKTPQSIHQWRQCDCLSQALNYYQDDNKLFEPSVHYLGSDGTGKTVSDFPIIYFTVAII